MTTNRLTISGHTDFSALKDKGFTLLEILLAIFIFSILVTTVFGSFNFLMKNRTGLIDIIEIDNMSSRFIQRLVLDLESIHISPHTTFAILKNRDIPDPYPIKGGNVIQGHHDGPALRFYSHSHLPFYNSSITGVAEIIYYLEKVSHDTNNLKRSDRLFHNKPFEPSDKDPIVCESVKFLSFSFFDKEGNRFDQWDSDSQEFDFSTPSAIAISFQVAGESGNYDFKTMIRIPVTRDDYEK